MNNLKKISLVLLALVFLASLAFVACTPNTTNPAISAEDALKNYIFEHHNQKLTESQLELPAEISGHKVTWISDSENLVVEYKEATAEDPAYYLATVVTPASGTVDVHLTLSFNATVSKTYTVRIAAISLHDVLSAYVFAQEKATVTKNFELDSSVTYEGKTATITWSVDEAYADYLAVDGYTCIVYQSSVDKPVKIKATFAMDGETREKEYPLVVSQEKSHLQEVDTWYNNSGVTQELRGYVVEMAEPYTGQFKNTTFYMIDEDFCCGYYIYRGGIDDTNGALMQRGAYVVVTGTINTNYNGLMETSQGGNVVVDTSKSISIEELEAKVYAIDQDILGDVPAAKYHQSTMVSLSNWTVKEIKAAADVTKSTNVLFVLTKGGVDVPVVISKYFKCAYAYTADDADTQALIALQSTLQVGDVVSLKGILGNYNGHQIALQDASHITVGGTADAAGTVYDGQTAKAAIDEVNKLWADNGLNDLVTLNKEINLVTAHNGVAIEYSLLANPQSADITAGKLTITAGKQEKVGVQITLTVNDYSTVMFKYFSSVALDDQGKADLEADELTLDFEEIKKDGTIALPAVGSIFGAEIAWAIDGTCDFASIEGNVLTVALPAEATTLKLVATITVGDKVATAEFVVAVAAKVFVSTCPAEGNYVIKLNTASSDLASDIYFDGGINNSEYLTTVTDINNAAVVTFAKVDGGYTLKVGDKYIEVYTNTNSKVRPTLVDTATGVWTWNEDVKVLVWDVDGTEYYLGSYTSSGTTFNTLSASKLSYISGDNASKIDVSQFPMHFADAPIVEDFETVLDAYNAAKVTNVQAGTAYKFALYYPADGLAYYLKDEVPASDTYKLATTTNLAEAVDVYLEVVSGGYYLSFTPAGGEKTYIEAKTFNNGGSLGVTTSPSAVYTITDGYLVATVDGVEVFLGGYNDYNNIRGSATSYMTSNPDRQYPARLVRGDVDINSYATPVEHVCESVCDTCGGCKDDACTEAVCATKCSCAPVVIPAPVAGTYNLVLVRNTGNFYFTGAMDSHYFATSATQADAAVVTLAYVDGQGYTMQLDDGNYLAVVVNGSYNNIVMQADAAYWQWNSEYGIFTITISTGEFFMGTRNDKDYTTISPCAMSYVETNYKANLEAVTVEEPDPSVHVCESKCEICGKCTNADCTEAVCADKCAGHEVVEPTHTCQNVCEECGKCTDADCTEAVCADKCAGHEVVEPTYETKTLAEFLALADDNTTHYKVSGIVHDIYNKTYGNLHLLDGTTDLTVYGLCANVMAFESNKWVNVQDFASLGIKEGDYITIIAAKGSYNGAGQAVGSGLDSIGTAPDAMAVDVAKQLLEVKTTLDADYTLPTFDFVTIAWSAPADSAIVIENGVAKVTRGSEDAKVVLTAVISSGETSSNVEFEVTVLKKVEITSAEFTYDFVTNFGTYGKSWNNSYTSRTVSSADLGSDLPVGTIVMSNANKQSGTITDRPVICAKNAVQYVTVTLANDKVSAITFNLMQWTDKTFKDIHIEFYDEVTSTWVSCSSVITTPAELSATGLPATGVSQFRLSFVSTKNSNTQIGLTSIVCTLAE